jgi:hypothetical protein
MRGMGQMVQRMLTGNIWGVNSGKELAFKVIEQRVSLKSDRVKS